MGRYDDSSIWDWLAPILVITMFVSLFVFVLYFAVSNPEAKAKQQLEIAKINYEIKKLENKKC